jgi:transposase
MPSAWLSFKNSARAEAARSLKINPNLIIRWMKEYDEDNDGQAFRENENLAPKQEEISKLKSPVRTLEMERNFLKEAKVFFAKEIKRKIC